MSRVNKMNQNYVCMQITCDRKSQIEQHLITRAHSEKQKIIGAPKQLLVTETLHLGSKSECSPQETFATDLCHLFVGYNIPLDKLDHPVFQNDLKQYCTISPSSTSSASSSSGVVVHIPAVLQ